jgi:hypothetical protein
MSTSVFFTIALLFFGVVSVGGALWYIYYSSYESAIVRPKMQVNIHPSQGLFYFGMMAAQLCLLLSKPLPDK